MPYTSSNFRVTYYVLNNNTSIFQVFIPYHGKPLKPTVLLSRRAFASHERRNNPHALIANCDGRDKMKHRASIEGSSRCGNGTCFPGNLHNFTIRLGSLTISGRVSAFNAAVSYVYGSIKQTLNREFHTNRSIPRCVYDSRTIKRIKNANPPTNKQKTTIIVSRVRGNRYRCNNSKFYKRLNTHLMCPCPQSIIVNQ